MSNKNLSFDFNDLQSCLFFRQAPDSALNPKESGDPEFIPTELSTETVDFFTLANGGDSLQPLTQNRLTSDLFFYERLKQNRL